MATIAATGIFKPLWIMKLMIAESASFQALVGAADYLEARDYIALRDINESDLCIPRVIIEFGDYSRSFNDAGVSSPFATSGQLRVIFEFEVSAEVDAEDMTREDESIWFLNTCGDIWADIETIVRNGAQLSGGENYLAIRDYSINTGPERLTPEERYLKDSDPPLPNLPAWFMIWDVNVS